LTCVDQRSSTGKEELLTVSSARGVIPRNTAKVTMFKAESYVGYKLCWPGDLAINSLWAWAGGLGVSQHHGIISTAYSVYRSRPSAQLNPRFLHELVRSSAFNWELQVRSKGIWISRLQLTDTAFLDAPIPLPPPSEQAAIVRFLDWANGRLERAIRAKRKVIALLHEQKQAIIHKAVTQGLDPNVPKKDSGVPWLGEIPAHWEVMPIKRVATVLNGFAFSSETYTDSGIPLIRIGDVKSTGSVDIEHAAKLPGDYLASHSFVEIKNGDLAMAMTGATIGKVARYTHDCPSLLNQRVCAFRCRSGRATQEYLFLLLSSRLYLQQVLMACYGGAQPNISDSTLADFKMPIAPFDLQNEIVASVTNETGPLTTAIERYEREITLLREYRTRLVADVVTGKLDVREAALSLPEEDVVLAAEDAVDEAEEPELEEVEG
jgi:type I restriction enzyme S subunit